MKNNIKSTLFKVLVSTLTTLFKLTFYIFILILIAKLSFKAYDFGYNLVYEKDKVGTKQYITLKINEDTNLKDVAKTLKNNQLIKTELEFIIQAKLYSYKVKEGEYTLERGISTKKIIETLDAKVNNDE